MIIKIQKNQYFSSFEGDFKVSQNIEMNYFNGNEYEVLYPTVSLTNTVNSLSASNVSYSNSSTSSIITSNQVQGAIDELFQSVSNGKNLIASAVTDKGVSTSGSSSWSVIAENIGKIETDSLLQKSWNNILLNADFSENENYITEPLSSTDWQIIAGAARGRWTTSSNFLWGIIGFRCRSGSDNIYSGTIALNKIDKQSYFSVNGSICYIKVMEYDYDNSYRFYCKGNSNLSDEKLEPVFSFILEEPK